MDKIVYSDVVHRYIIREKIDIIVRDISKEMNKNNKFKWNYRTCKNIVNENEVDILA